MTCEKYNGGSRLIWSSGCIDDPFSVDRLSPSNNHKSVMSHQKYNFILYIQLHIVNRSAGQQESKERSSIESIRV